ncbi:MAG: sugar phosphate nucleotidyltransferase [bacterium]|nr:sugar phosphate nucleotidyltransferase [bacterium]
MQYIILAGGLGTRLRPLTESVPKPMVPLLGRPFLEYQLGHLRRQGVREALLLVGYLGERIEAHFGDGGRIGVRLRYSRERELRGTAGALRLAAPMIGGDFVLIYGDSFLPLDRAAFEAAFRDRGAEGMIAVYRDRRGETGVRGNVALDADGYVERYEKDAPPPGLPYVEAGVLAFRRGVLDRIPAARAVSLEGEVYPALIRERRLAGYASPVRFFDIGTGDRLREMEAWLRDDYLKDAVPG